MKKNKKNLIKNEIIGLITISFGLFALVSIYSEAGGAIGNALNILISGIFGFGAYFIPVIIIVSGVFILISKTQCFTNRNIICSLIIFILVLTIFNVKLFNAFNFDDSDFKEYLLWTYNNGISHSGGGLIGGLFAFLFTKLLGIIGSYIAIITLIIINFLIITKISLTNVFSVLQKKMKVKSIKKNKVKVEQSGCEIYDKNLQQTADNIQPAEQQVNIINYENKSVDKPKTSEINISMPPLKGYKYPTLDLLNKSDFPKLKSDKKLIMNNVNILENTLDSFGVSAKVVQVSRGPVITRYELQPAAGVKVSKIASLVDDIALNMAASGVRIEAPIPGKAAVGIEVPNKNAVSVLLSEVISSQQFQKSNSCLSIGLGKDIAGNNIIADLSDMPHLLIAGATGSGKSVCINTIITSLLYKATPDQLRLLLIDPKVVELSSYNGIPHLLIPVVTDPQKAAGALNWTVQEMNNRYKSFAKTGVKDIDKYNQTVSKQGDNPLPKVVVIIDELADLMMVSPHEVEDSICRIAQMARAAGIHLVIATQRPSVDVITGVIKANIPSRIAFSVSSQADSRTILDMGGAEKLLGKGDMLFFPVGLSKPKRVQGAYISEKEVERVVNFVKQQLEVEYHQEIFEEIAAEKSVDKEHPEDELLMEAIELIIENEQASISMLQRKLRIGYARAARLIDDIEEMGIISGYDGSRPRNVLISRQEWEEMKRIRE
ncbi:MAG: DNA translocase FtsK 4TM domain-containing protein [Clostridia bacterium]|nr:DNA translocase FtsK 4TM domain-containing protein [Clostridia bacterium]